MYERMANLENAVTNMLIMILKDLRFVHKSEHRYNIERKTGMFAHQD
jgi:hypothetical protein